MRVHMLFFHQRGDPPWQTGSLFSSHQPCFFWIKAVGEHPLDLARRASV